MVDIDMLKDIPKPRTKAIDSGYYQSYPASHTRLIRELDSAFKDYDSSLIGDRILINYIGKVIVDDPLPYCRIESFKVARGGTLKLSSANRRRMFTIVNQLTPLLAAHKGSLPYNKDYCDLIVDKSHLLSK